MQVQRQCEVQQRQAGGLTLGARSVAAGPCLDWPCARPTAQQARFSWCFTHAERRNATQQSGDVHAGWVGCWVVKAFRVCGCRQARRRRRRRRPLRSARQQSRCR